MRDTMITECAPRGVFRRQFQVLLPVYLNVFLMGCTTGWVPNAIYLLKRDPHLYADPFETVLIIISAEFGRLLMALPEVNLINKFGRKNVIIASGTLHFICWQFLSLNTCVITLCLARFVLGIATALVNATAMTSIYELASPEIRPKLTRICQLFSIFGIAFECIITVGFSSFSKLTYCNLIMSAISFVITNWAIETPQYLISINENQQALLNLKYTRPGYSMNEIESEFKILEKFIESEKQHEFENNWSKFFDSEDIRTPLIISFLINFFGMATGWFVTLTFITTLIPNIAVIREIYFPSIAFAITTFITLCLPLYVEKFRPRSLLMPGAIALFLGNTVLAISYYYILRSCYACYNAFTLSTFFLGIVMSSLVQPVLSLLNDEVLPESIKIQGNSLCVIAQTSANIVSMLIIYYLFFNLELYYTYGIFMANSLVLFFLVYFFSPKTKNNSVQDMESS